MYRVFFFHTQLEHNYIVYTTDVDETAREIIYLYILAIVAEGSVNSGRTDGPPPCLKANEMIRFQADDPDTKKQITYMIKQGDTELFAIDQRTGVIKTTRGLDYERESQHILIIGTVENTSDLPGSTTRVVVNVQVSILNRISLFPCSFFCLRRTESFKFIVSYRYICVYICMYVSLVAFACSFLL